MLIRSFVGGIYQSSFHRICPRPACLLETRYRVIDNASRSFVTSATTSLDANQPTDKSSRSISYHESLSTPMSDNASSKSSIKQSNNQPVKKSRLNGAEYSGSYSWTCNKCQAKNSKRVRCPCGEVNEPLMERINLKRKQWRETPNGKASAERKLTKRKEEKRDILSEIRLALTMRSNTTGTCEWEGCSVPLHLLNIHHVDHSDRNDAIGRLSPIKALESMQTHTLSSGEIRMKALCPLHHSALLMNEMIESGRVLHPIAKKSAVRVKKEMKIKKKYCTHDRCFHPDIPECNDETAHLFSFDHIVDAVTGRQINLDPRARSKGSVSQLAKRHSLAVAKEEIEKCRLLHNTCERDHTLRKFSMTLDEKKNFIRSFLKTHSIPDWLHQAITEALDRHDAEHPAVDKEADHSMSATNSSSFTESLLS